jgi:hypothetical protein
MTQWWGKLFTLDDPAFKLDAFEAAVQTASRWPTTPRFQQRHFYFMAHEIAEIADPHERKFICDWVAKTIGRTNEYFQPIRWEEYCHLTPDSYQRKAVQHGRAKATGAAEVPEHPWKARQAQLKLDHPDWFRDDEPADDVDEDVNYNAALQSRAGTQWGPNGGQLAGGRIAASPAAAPPERRVPNAPAKVGPDGERRRPAGQFWNGYNISAVDPALRQKLQQYDRDVSTLSATKEQLVSQLAASGTPH